MNIVEIKGLTKHYGKKTAIDSLGLEIPVGSIYGLLGCNGAGKTTTLNIISGIIKKNAGEVIVSGLDIDKDPTKIKEMIGVMPQDVNLYSGKTIRENILYFSRLKGKEEKIDSLLKKFQLNEILSKKAKELSHGQEKIALILQAFLGNPKLVILDEPISGFDPKVIVMLRKFIKEKKTDQTIIISSHNLDEVDRLCTHIGMIHEGKIILQGKKDKIKKGKSLESVFIKKLR